MAVQSCQHSFLLTSPEVQRSPAPHECGAAGVSGRGQLLGVGSRSGAGIPPLISLRQNVQAVMRMAVEHIRLMLPPLILP